MSRNAEKAPKRPTERPKTTPRGAQDDQKSDPERQDDKRTEPRRFQDRLGSAPRGPTPVWWHPRGTIWEAKSAPKRIQKRCKNEMKIQESKKHDPRRSWTRLGAILGRLGCHLGALETLWHYACRCFVKIHFFDVKTVRRRLWDQLWPTKAP